VNSPLFASYLYIHLPLLIIVISLIYSATRHDEWSTIFHETFRWIVRMTGFLGAIAVALFLVAWLI
jgi:choline-glycine betaine transporter